MSTFLKIIPFLFLVMFSSLTAAEEAISSNIIAKIDQFIIKQIKEKKTIGCAVAIVDQGKIVFIKPYGVLKQGKKAPVTSNTLFQLGSISKSLTATLIAKMIKDKHLDLEMETSTFLPLISPNITLRHILSHTTGYKRAQWNKEIEAGTSRENLLQQLGEVAPLLPGQTFDYHNLAFSLVEEAVEKQTNRPFANSLKEMLLTPLGMKRTLVKAQNFAKLPDFAWPHQKNNKGVLYTSKNYRHDYARTVCSAGGMSSSITDMATFLQLQLGFIPDFLTEQDLTFLHTPQIEAADALQWFKKSAKENLQSYYGLGWRILDYEEERIVFHGGWIKGFTNFLGFIPHRKVGIVVLNNLEGKFAMQVAFTFFDMIMESSHAKKDLRHRVTLPSRH